MTDTDAFNAQFDDWQDQWVALNGEPPDPRQAARAVWDRIGQLKAVCEAARYAHSQLSELLGTHQYGNAVSRAYSQLDGALAELEAK